MGSALLTRWLDQKLVSDVVVVEPYGFEMAGVTSVADIKSLPADFKPDVVVFAVKPQILGDIIADYKEFDQALFLSIAAGKPIAFFEEHLGNSAKIVRSMPNTPAAIGMGATVATANARVSDNDRKNAEKLLSAVGTFFWVEDEALLNPVTALSGSGPAYVFLLIEAMTAAGTKIGLSPDMAEKLARQTVIGSAALAAESADITAATLRQNVTSPGGTTAAALKVLMDEQNGIQPLFDEALAAATKRAEELSK